MHKARIAVILFLIGILALPIWAGETGKAPMSKEKMAEMKMQMKGEFSKCQVCKAMVPYMETEWWWGTNHEVYDLKNGMVVMHWIADNNNVGNFHKMCGEMKTAQGEVMKMSQANLQTKLCQHCQNMAAIGKEGANFEGFETKNGNMWIVTSDKPETVNKIHTMAGETRQMLGISQEKTN
ncbi:MAG: hypothetical protein A2145_03035 [candidate division Zixibacteria bacterium RBG_16_40_9]|nr:MAG: hypothetical protein A2145_03035 [candidate division Zixibacteria bacterium RBG_16_40_9]